jgi:hypothetical protein
MLAVLLTLAPVMAPVMAQAGGPPPGSPAYLLQQARLSQQGAMAPGAMSPQASAAAVAQSIANMQSAAQSLFAARAAQISGAAMAAGNANPRGVTNGLTVNGLAVDPNAVPGASGYASHPDEHWLNANLPTQTVANGRTEVTVTQTAKTAVLTWNKFNVGPVPT